MFEIRAAVFGAFDLNSDTSIYSIVIHCERPKRLQVIRKAGAQVLVREQRIWSASLGLGCLPQE